MSPNSLLSSPLCGDVSAWPAQHSERDAVSWLSPWPPCSHRCHQFQILTLNWRTKLRANSTISHNTGLQGNRFKWTEVEKCLHIAHVSLSLVWTLYGVSIDKDRPGVLRSMGVTKSWIGLSGWTTNGQYQYCLFSLWNLHSYIRNFFFWPQGFGICDISSTVSLHWLKQK